MFYRVRRKLPKHIGLIILVVLPVLLALWFARLRAMTETENQLQTFAQSVLDRTELVTQQAALAFKSAEQFQGQSCSQQHRENMLNIIRGRLYIHDLIYAKGADFLCSTTLSPLHSYTMKAADYNRNPDISIYYYRDTPFYGGYRMIYLQRGNYVAVINPRSFSDITADNGTTSYGIFDTVTNLFFSLNERSDVGILSSLMKEGDASPESKNLFYTIVRSPTRSIAVIVSLPHTYFYTIFYHQLTLTLPLGLICSLIIFFMWLKNRRETNSPRRMLQRALNSRQLRLHYQPIIDLKNNTCVGAEALLRWPGLKDMVMSPAVFIPLAEKEGMITQVTDYVVEEVFNDLGEFLSRNPQLYISINLSASDFYSSRLIALIVQKSKKYSVLAQQIKIEVTERGFIDVPKAVPVIQAFRKAGYEVAIDDFGTGYSNLHNLYSLSVDILKIDKVFIDTLNTNSSSHLIAEHIIEMAQGLHLQTIAEGVETAEQVSWLSKRGVGYCQGWYFSKALAAQDFVAWVQQPAH